MSDFRQALEQIAGTISERAAAYPNVNIRIAMREVSLAILTYLDKENVAYLEKFIEDNPS